LIFIISQLRFLSPVYRLPIQLDAEQIMQSGYEIINPACCQHILQSLSFFVFSHQTVKYVILCTGERFFRKTADCIKVFCAKPFPQKFSGSFLAHIALLLPYTPSRAPGPPAAHPGKES